MQPSKSRAIGALSHATRDYRFGLMRELMDREKLDALAFMTDAFIKFASNWSLDVASFERPTLFVFPRNGAPFALLHELSTSGLRFARDMHSLWVDDVEFYAEHPRVRNRLPLSFQWNDWVAARLERAGLQHGRIGIDSDELARVGGTLLGLARVRELLPDLQLENVAGKCAEMLVVKHEEELAILRAAADLANWGQERWHEQVKPGLLTAEVDTRVASLIVEEAARRYPPGVELAVACQTISSPGTWFGTVPSDRVENGSALVTSVTAQLNALGATSERTRFYGQPSQRLRQLFEAARAASEAACQAAVAGRPASQVGMASRAVFERAGLMSLALDAGPTDPTPLKERQVLSIAPGVYEWGIGGCRHGDLVIVGKEPEVLTTTPKDIASQTLA